MDYKSGIKFEDIKREFLADLERQHARAQMEVYAASGRSEIRAALSKRNKLATQIHNAQIGESRAPEFEQALIDPPPPPSRLKKLLRR